MNMNSQIAIDGPNQLLYQWDTGQRILLRGYGAGTRVDFARYGQDKAASVYAYEENGTVFCDIPDALLMEEGYLRGYVYESDGDKGETIRLFLLPVISRSKPEGYVEPEDQLTWYALEKRLAELEGEGLAQAVADYMKENPVQTGATEEEAAQIAKNREDIASLTQNQPVALPNPHPLTINGKAYDGSEAVDVMIEDGSASIDVTAEVGQAILVKETDGNGKPTAWEAADYQPRTHWMDEDGTVHKLANQYIDAEWMATRNVTGGNTVYIPEQSVSGGVWRGLQIGMQPDLQYAVSFNGEEYICRARTYGNGVILGNNSGMTYNDDPFCIMWAGGTATSGMFYKRSDISYPVTLKVTDPVGYAYERMPEEYLPDCVVKSVNGAEPDADGNVEIEAGGVDVTAEVGQTIVVEEVDENGKPTRWKAAEHQPRTHWTEETVVVPETTLAVEDGAAFTGLDFMYVAGKEYKVMYNGEEYFCTAIDLGDGVAAVGNVDVLLGTGDNGMPFASLWEFELAFVVLDDTASITVSVAEVHHMPIPVQYMSNALPYCIEILENDSGVYTCAETVAELADIYDSGRAMVMRPNFRQLYGGSGAEEVFLRLSLSIAVPTDNGLTLVFGGLSGFEGVTKPAYMTLTPQEDGTYVITAGGLVD